MSIFPRHLACLWLGFLTLAAPLRMGFAEPRPVAASQTPQMLGEADLGAFFDGVVAGQLAAYQVPGAVVAVVQAGRLLLARGYGVADLRTGRPVSAERTLFRAGSVSKVFTATAVMQLADQGRLDLDADVNRYLDGLQVPETFPEPITLGHLLTHTAGFEDRFFGLFAADATTSLPLDSYLSRYRPVRVRPPGQVSAYSNYGTALAGHIVARVSARPFGAYVAEEILAPLGMSRSSFQQPLPDALSPELAVGYGNRLEAFPFEWLQPAPAGALSTTATDMARFMIAHLGQGRHGDARILAPAAAEAMQRRQFSNDPRAAGLTYGFEEFFQNGQRVLWQPGDTLAFSSAMILLPEHQLGVFVSYNRLAHSQPRADLLKVFLDRYFPARPRPPPPPLPDFASRAVRYAGSYLPTRSNLTTVEKVFKLFKPVTVRAMPDGLLRISGLWVMKDSLWVEVEPLVLHSLSAEEIVVFHQDVRGRVALMIEGNYPQGAYTRLPWYGSYGLHYALALGCALAFLSAVVLWPVCRCFRHRAGVRAPAGARRALGLGAGMSLVNLVFLTALLVMLVNLRRLAPVLETWMTSLLLLPWLGAGLAVACAAMLPVAWRRGYWGLGMRLHYTVVVVAGLLFIAFAGYWNLLGHLL